MSRFFKILLTVLGLWILAGVLAAWSATAPNTGTVQRGATIADIVADNVSIRTEDGLTVRGWLCIGNQSRCVVLAAGIGANRTALVNRATWWIQHGWSALLVDLRGTGESDSTPIAFGWNEAADLVAWRRYLDSRGFLRVGAHGQSLGAAAIAYAAGRGVDWAFVVLESCYDDVRHSLANRAPWVPLPAVSLWPMTMTAEMRTGVHTRDLRPIAFGPRLTMPTWILAGDSDVRVRPAESEALFAAVAARRKQLVWIRGAGHVDLWQHDAAACERALADLARDL